MSLADLASRLENAERRVVEARRIVARHRQRVLEQTSRRPVVPRADEVLDVFVGALKVFEDYERLLRFEAERTGRTASENARALEKEPSRARRDEL